MSTPPREPGRASWPPSPCSNRDSGRNKSQPLPLLLLRGLGTARSDLLSRRTKRTPWQADDDSRARGEAALSPPATAVAVAPRWTRPRRRNTDSIESSCIDRCSERVSSNFAHACKHDLQSFAGSHMVCEAHGQVFGETERAEEGAAAVGVGVAPVRLCLLFLPVAVLLISAFIFRHHLVRPLSSSLSHQRFHPPSIERSRVCSDFRSHHTGARRENTMRTTSSRQEEEEGGKKRRQVCEDWGQRSMLSAAAVEATKETEWCG